MLAAHGWGEDQQRTPARAATVIARLLRFSLAQI